jgi:hypothetical protein
VRSLESVLWKTGKQALFFVPPCFNTNNKPHDGPWPLRVILYEKGVCGGTSLKSVSDVRASFLPGISKKNISRGIPEKNNGILGRYYIYGPVGWLTISLTFSL